MGELISLIQLLDMAKDRNTLTSDVKLAEALGMKSANITRMRKRQQYPSGGTCIKLAALTGVSEAIVFAIVQMEKADTVQESRVWKSLAQMASTMAIIFMLALASLSAAPSSAYASDGTDNMKKQTEYQLCDIYEVAIKCYASP